MRVRSYISYSQLVAFEQGKYVEKYLQGINPENKYQRFGKRFHEALMKDTKDENIEKLKLFLSFYKDKEIKIDTEIEGIPILGIPDGVNRRKKEFGDYKTGKKWTQSMADKSDQITFYYILLWKKYGWISKRAFIHWVETTEDEGELRFTGKIKTFETIRTMRDMLLFFGRIKRSWQGIEVLCNKEFAKIKPY